MPERTPPPAEQPAPSIPDGGLGEAMPEWLRRPPAWRDLESKASSRRPLPPPDTSVIDPATLIAVEDLPHWLQRLAAPRELPTLESIRPSETPARRVIPRVIEASSPTAGPPAPAQPERTERGPVPAGAEGPGAAPEMAPHVLLLDDSEVHAQPQPNAAIVLGTLLGVAVVIIIVLLVVLLT